MGFSTLTPASTTTQTSGSNNRSSSNSAGGTRNQCYAPNGPSNQHRPHFTSATTSTRSNSNNGGGSSFVNNVLTSMATSLSNSSQSATSTLLGHFRSWQRSRRLRALGKQQQQQQQQQLQLQNNFQGVHHNQHHHPSMNNLCYQSMALNNNNTKSTTDLYYHHHRQPPFTRSNHNNNRKKKKNGEVELQGGGGDAIAMQLMVGGDRVMVNENQLYSMNSHHHHHHHQPNYHHPHHTHHTHHQPLYRTLSDNCYISLDPPEAVLTTTTTSLDSPSSSSLSALEAEELNSELWYYGSITRERATALVSRACTGSFLVRSSGTFSTSYALTVKVPADHSHTGVCHYLILRTEEEGEGGKFKIKGFSKEFDTVQSLIIHHTIMKEQLPCTLKLQQQPNYTNSTTTLGSKASSHFYNTVKHPSHATPHSSLYGNFYNTYKKACSSEEEEEEVGGVNNCSSNLADDHDLMVDVDLDPTYQQILDNFRKVMAQCS